MRSHKLPQPPRNLVVYVRRIVDARLPEPVDDSGTSKCVTMKILMGMQKERCGTNNIRQERRPLRSPAADQGPGNGKGTDAGESSDADADAALAGASAAAGGAAAAAASTSDVENDARHRVLFERAAVFSCPPNPSRVGSWEHSVRTTRVGHLQSIAARSKHRENAFRRSVGLESLEEQAVRVADGITLDDDDDAEDEEQLADSDGKTGQEGAASGAGADDPSSSTAIVRRGRVKAKAIDARAAALRRGPYGEMGVGAVPREFATMLRAARAAEEAAAAEGASEGAGASESKEGGDSESKERAPTKEELAQEVQRLQQTAVAAAADATAAAGERKDAQQVEEDILTEADFLHREADEMDDEEAGNSLQLLANL